MVGPVTQQLYVGSMFGLVIPCSKDVLPATVCHLHYNDTDVDGQAQIEYIDQNCHKLTPFTFYPS